MSTSSKPSSTRAAKKPASQYQYGLGWELYRFFNNPLLHDLVLQTDVRKPSLSRGCLSSGSFYAHRDILASRSGFFFKFFQNMSQGNVFEIVEEQVTVHIKLQNEQEPDAMELDEEEAKTPLVYISCSADALDLVLRFLYKGTFDISNILPPSDDDSKYFQYVQVELIPQLIALCTLFEIDSLKNFLVKRRGRDLSKLSLAMNDKFKIISDNIHALGTVTVRVADGVFPNQSPVLLSARSTFFAAVLSGKWSERTDVIKVEMVPSEAMRQILAFINSEEQDLALGSLQEVLEVLQWSFYLGVNSLIHYCEHALDTEHLNFETVCPIWNLVSSHAETEFLSQKCEAFLQNNFLQCARNDYFLVLRRDLLKSLLDAGKINAESLDMMCAIKRWADARARTSPEAKDLFFQMLPPHTMFNTFNRMLLLGVVDGGTMHGIPRSFLLSMH